MTARMLEDIVFDIGYTLAYMRAGLKAKSTMDFYNRLSPLYDEYFGSTAGLRHMGEFIGEYLAGHDIAPEALLEVGCGTGMYSAELEGICKRLYGVDFSKGQLAQAQKKGLRIRLTRGNILALPYSDDSFDVVTSMAVVRHLRGMELSYFKEAYRVLRPGGVLFFEPFWENSYADPFTLPLFAWPPLRKAALALYHRFVECRGLDECALSPEKEVVTRALEEAGFEVETLGTGCCHIMGRKPAR